MTSHSLLPAADMVAAVMVSILGLIVIYDAWMIWKPIRDIPNLGKLPGGGHAWQSEGSQEVTRHWANLITIAAMMILPWPMAQASDTSITWVIVWDLLLGFHTISVLWPKRYAVTTTHLFADGGRFEWTRLKLANKQPRSRIMLLRKGWGIFAPLPIGGSSVDLEIARIFINTVLDDESE